MSYVRENLYTSGTDGDSYVTVIKNATYAGYNAAPANGLIVQGKVGIGSSAPGAAERNYVILTPPKAGEES